MVEPGVGGAGRGVFQGRFEFVTGSLFRDPNGTYTSFTHEADVANKRLAAQLQEKVAQALRHGLKRPTVSTGMLEKATADPRNRFGSKEGFGVGIVRFLDSDEAKAKYWLQIERGSRVHMNKPMFGVWTDAISYVGAEYQKGNAFSQRAPAGQLFEFGAPDGHAFLPVGTKWGRRMLKEQGQKAGRRSGFRVKGIIHNPIQAEEYYLRGWEEFNWLASVQREYDAVFRKVGYKVQWVNNRLTRTPLRGQAAAGRRQARSQQRFR